MEEGDEDHEHEEFEGEQVEVNPEWFDETWTEEEKKDADPTRGKVVDAGMKTLYQWLNLVAFLICIGLNYASATIMPITLKEISDKYDVRIAPASWAFIIWSVIYTLLAVYAIY